jgi:hypothetical protein
LLTTVGTLNATSLMPNCPCNGVETVKTLLESLMMAPTILSSARLTAKFVAPFDTVGIIASPDVHMRDKEQPVVEVHRLSFGFFPVSIDENNLAE